jgi:hypothetical protein
LNTSALISRKKSANYALGLNYVLSVQAWYICLNLIDLSKKSTFSLFKTVTLFN